MCISQQIVKNKILKLVQKYIEVYGPDNNIDYNIDDEYGLPVFIVKSF